MSGTAAYDALIRKNSNVSSFITTDQFLRVFRGIQYANYRGYILNTELTIAWKCAGIDAPSDVDRMNMRAMDRIRKFLEYRKIPVFYYGVFENGILNGYHFHAAIYVPPLYKSQFKDCLKKMARDFALPHLVNDFVRGVIRRADKTGAQWRWFQYCMKGLDPVVYRDVVKFPYDKDMNTLVGVQRRNPGVVEIDRVRIARSMGPKARMDAGYRAELDITRAEWQSCYTDAEYKRGKLDRRSEEVTQSFANMDLI